jgi:anti-anti-sigma factor
MKILSRPIKSLTVSGSLDNRHYTELQQQLNDLQTHPNDVVIFDLQQVTQINSSGIGVLILLLKQLTANRVSLYLYQPTQTVLLTLQMSGMLNHFKIGNPTHWQRPTDRVPQLPYAINLGQSSCAA